MAAKLNMQNIPARNKDIKKLFRARPGYTIINCDLATAEIYVAAAMSQDPYLCNIFTSGQDFHSNIAKTCFGIAEDASEIKALYPEKRQASKALSFGILYGSSEYRVAAELNKLGVKITIVQARHLIAEYFRNASILKEYLNANESILRKTGKLQFAQGRLRTIPDVFNRNAKVVEHAIRSGLNTLFQGPSSDIMLCGYTDLVRDFIRPTNASNPDMVNPFTIVHDSLTSEVHNSIISEYCAAAKEAIQKPRYFIPDIGVPVGVDFEMGASWGEVT